MNALNYIVENPFAILMFFQILTTIGLVYLGTKFAPKQLEKEVEKIDKRLSTIESEIKHLPNVTQFHQLELSISNLVGNIKALEERLEATDKQAERLTKQINLMDQSLRGQK